MTVRRPRIAYRHAWVAQRAGASLLPSGGYRRRGGWNGELEGRVESLRRTPAGVRATIAIDGYDQTLEIDSPLDAAAALGDRVPLSLAKARIFPADENGEYVDAGEGI